MIVLPALLRVTVEPARLLGAVVTVSVPSMTRLPALVKLERARPKPLSVTVDPAAMLKVEITTGALSTGITVAAPMMAASLAPGGTLKSQLAPFDQLESAVPSQ